MTSIQLPPWGFMHEAYMTEMADEPIPKDWRLANGAAPTQKDWQEWIELIADELSEFLWPRYDVVTSSWQGASAANIDALNDADFELLANLHPILDKPISARFQTLVNHGDFFAAEDTKPLGENYLNYDPLLARDLRAAFPKTLRDGYANKVGSYDLQLKWRLQRPRPLQVSYLQSRKSYSFRLAMSANTPSLVSGHCLQGSLAGCNAFTVLAAIPTVDSKSIDILKQFTVDIGDRRVFAGVHYPSDNISSWYAALRLIPHVFQGTSAAEFLWSAITTKSLVFAAIDAHIKASPKSPYAKPISILESLAAKA